MKKNYFLAAILSFAMISMNAQFVDDMESYTDGQPISTGDGTTNGDWTDWGCGGGAGCAIMSSSVQARSGQLSGLVPDDGTTDAVLSLGNKIFDQWGLEFFMYVPSGNQGYFNLQGTIPIGSGEWITGNFTFADGGAGNIDDSALGSVDFTFPQDTWFRIVMNFDIANGIGLSTWEMTVDNVQVIPVGTAFTKADGTYPTSLGGFDFFSDAAGLHTAYYDDFDYGDSFKVGILSVQDLDAKGFDAFKDRNNILNLKANETINNVAIYNMLGQVVYNTNINATQSTIDMSSFANGTYIVKVNVSGTEGSIKVIR